MVLVRVPFFESDFFFETCDLCDVLGSRGDLCNADFVIGIGTSVFLGIVLPRYSMTRTYYRYQSTRAITWPNLRLTNRFVALEQRVRDE